MKKALGVGNESFLDLIESGCYYVDKTAFMKPLLAPGSSVRLITRPRRFGKSLFINTIQEFLRVDPGHPGDASRQERLFSGLRVLEDKTFCEQFMGRTPVLSLSFKEAEGESFDAAYDSLAQVLAEVAKDHAFLAESPRLDADDREIFRQYRSTAFMRRIENRGLAAFFIRNMVKFLARHFGRPAVLLIDEYDVPLAKAAFRGYYDRMVEFMRTLLSPLKTGGGATVNGAPVLGKAILTGCLRVSKESLFTGVNNLEVNTVCSMDAELAPAIGFTPGEVGELLACYGLESRREDVRRWYDGYRISEQELYCPWDMMSFVKSALKSPDPQSCAPQSFWANTGGTDLIDKFLGGLDKAEAGRMQALMDGGEITFRLNEQLTYGDIDLRRPDDFWTLLLYTGYLTLAEPAQTGRQCRARIPNEEVREVFAERIQERFSAADSRFSRAGRDFALAALQGDADAMNDILDGVLEVYVSVRDSATRAKTENYYHGFLLALLASAGEDADNLRSNAEAGDGFADILLISSARPRTGVVIELKHSRSDAGMEADAGRALPQIEDKHYVQGLAGRRCARFLGCGIAFVRKRCFITGGVIEG